MHLMYKIERDGTGQPVPWQDFELVPLSRDNEGTSVPLSRKVALSRPVGNPSLNVDRFEPV